MGIDDEHFEEPLKTLKEQKGYKSDTEMTAADWAAITEAYKQVVHEQMGFEFPQDPYKQLELAAKAVFDS